MRILFIVNSLANGGAERVCSELASYFSVQNDVCILITSIKVEHVYDVGNARIEYLNEGKYVSPLFKTKLCYKWMKKIKPDIVIAFPDPCSYYGAIAAKKLRIPCICSERNAPMFQPEKRLMRIMRFIAYKKASAIVFQTEDAMNWFPKSIRKKGVVIWNPYQLDNQFNSSDVNYETIDALVNAGRIVPQKNHMLLIEAFKQFNLSHPNVSLHIFGKGDSTLMQNLHNKVEELGVGDKVVFMGFSKDLKKDLVKYPVFIMSSNHEGMPNALLEAAISGLTCVSTDCVVGGPRELLKNCDAHYLVPCNDATLLANAMKAAYENRQKDKRIVAEYGMKLKKNVSIETIGQKWMELMEDLLK